MTQPRPVWLSEEERQNAALQSRLGLVFENLIETMREAGIDDAEIMRLAKLSAPSPEIPMGLAERCETYIKAYYEMRNIDCVNDALSILSDLRAHLSAPAPPTKYPGDVTREQALDYIEEYLNHHKDTNRTYLVLKARTLLTRARARVEG